MSKKNLRTIIEFTVAMAIIMTFLHLSAIAASTLPLDPETATRYKEGLLPGPYSADVDNAYDTITQLVLELLSYAKIIIAAMAVLYITIMGYKIATAGEEEEAKKMQKGIVYAIAGLVLISLSSDLAKVFDMNVFSSDGHTLFETPEEIVNRVRIFDTEVEVVITFIKYVIAFYAALMLVRFSLKFITRGGNEEKAKESKLKILFAIGGLVLIYLADIFINNVFYKINKESYNAGKIDMGIDPGRGVSELISITNIIVSFIGPVAILMLIVSGVMYITSGGEDDKMQKAKRMLIATIVGIIIIYGAFAIVSTVLSGSLDTTNTGNQDTKLGLLITPFLS